MKFPAESSSYCGNNMILLMDMDAAYRCPFRPPGPALTQARGGPLNFVSGLAWPSHHAMSCKFTGCDDGPSPSLQA